jgi:hypothetical protein
LAIAQSLSAQAQSRSPIARPAHRSPENLPSISRRLKNPTGRRPAEVIARPSSGLPHLLAKSFRLRKT